jgi:hypothetical protein
LLFFVKARPAHLQDSLWAAYRLPRAKENFVMTDDQSEQRVSDQLHPSIHLAAAGLLIWFVVAAWLLFGGSGYIDLALTMISVLVFMAIAIPLALLRAGVKALRSDDASNGAGRTSESLGAWLQGQFATWTDQEKGSAAAAEILLPLAAVAFGITALGIVLELTRTGVV